MKQVRVTDDPIKLSYAAGIIDGEGTIQIVMGRGRGKVSKYHVVEVSVSSTENVLIDWLYEHFSGGVVSSRTNNNNNPNARPLWIWKSRHHHAEAFLRAVRPYLILKQERADIALECRETMFKHSDPKSKEILSDELIQKREDLRNRIKELNVRGVVKK